MSGHKDFFDSRARQWDETKEPGEVLNAGKIIDTLDIKPGERILDAGCGTGFLFPLLIKKAGKDGVVTGLDISGEMIKQARKKYKDRVKYLHSPVDEIHIQKGFFDRVICYSAFPHFPDKLQTLKEFWRVLKKGGKIHILHSSSREEINLMHSQIGKAVKNDMVPSEKVMKRLLEESGFCDIDIKDKKDSCTATAKKCS